MRRPLILALAAAALAGCSAAPFTYQSQREIPPGPGMLSGADGAFVLRAGGAPASRPLAASDESREFDDYRAFQRWKGSVAGTDEEREFQEWREWREWRRRNPPAREAR